MSDKPHGTNYAAYLKLDALLATQQPLTDDPDELHFIVVHQVHELWFKLALHHLERARAAMQAGDTLDAARLVGQVAAIFDNLTQTVEHLHSLPPMAFHHFRRFLAPGSGLQSYQFREIEVVAGRRDAEYLAWIERVLVEPEHRALVTRHLAQPSLADALAGQVAAAGVPDIATIYADPGAHPALYALCEALSVLDHAVVTWRFSHIQLVERTIGAATTGTGGTTHDYLTGTMRVRLFPALWAARNDLTRRMG